MELLVLNEKFESVAVVDRFKSLIWTDRYNSWGDFELYLPPGEEMPFFVRENWYLWNQGSDHVMIMEDISVESDAEEGSQIKITGRSLESILDRRIVWGQKILSGSLQDGIRTLLNEAFISPAIPERKIPNFIFEPSSDPKITGLKMDTQFTGDDLYSVIKGLCEANHLGFRIRLTEDGKFAFGLYSGANRSYGQMENPYVVFSPHFENIIGSNYFTSKANLKNVTLVAGEGEGASRKTAAVGSGSGLDRRELFTDARDISSDTENGTISEADYLTLLQARGAKTLADYRVNTAFEGEVEATRLFRYGEDFFIGDTVQIADEFGHEGAAYISELILSQSDEGISVVPTFQMLQEEGAAT